MADSFPRQKARTRNFTLGAPRSFTIGHDGSRVVFLRSPAGDDPRTALWAFDVADERERLVVGADDLLAADGGEELSLEERARRERARETAGGIVAFATDRDARVAAFVLSGRLFLADLAAGGARELDVPGPVFDPRPDPSGQRVAFVHEQALHVVDLNDGAIIRLAGEDSSSVSWGMAEFVAAEEMDRGRGYWWSPRGDALLVERVDEAPVAEVWIADPAHPAAPPRSIRYPLAGSANADVQVHLIGLDGTSTQVIWDDGAHPYLAAAHWDEHGPMIAVQARDQRSLITLVVDATTGRTSPLGSQSDEQWVDLVPGVPRRLADGRLVTAGGAGETVALLVDAQPVTSDDLEVRSVIGVGDEAVVFTAGRDPTEVHVWRWDAVDGPRPLTSDSGVHTAVGQAGRCVIGSAGLEHDGTRWSLGGHSFSSGVERPLLTPSVQLLTIGREQLRAGLVLPRDHQPGTPLPVLMDPYAGPHFQRVIAARQAWLESQWLADQGFAVLVVDGRGTPGRGRRWARAVAGDLAGPVLEDQICALHEVASNASDLDLSRVGIRGWSFGGYLAALAVLRRPDVFHAAVAGAPVTDWRLYDTHYTERYLGIAPEGADGAAYERSSLLRDAADLRRPLLLIHGLADDNVLSAHTLQLSQRLTESGVLHTVLPLTGITHMTPQEAVAENLLTVQVEFLHRALTPSAGPARHQPRSD